MNKGYLCFFLHAHLPFVRHPEYESFLEENWLYEAISETYLPLLRVFRRLRGENIPFKLTISISPSLAAMLSDNLLQNRYIDHLNKMVELADKEINRTKEDPEFYQIALMYKDLFQMNLDDFTGIYKKNILNGFKFFEKEGYIEVITTAATHSFLPLYQEYSATIEAQVNTAVVSHRNIFGKNPSGLWLPECGYFPGLENYLKQNNIEYFFTAAHGILFADKISKYGVYAPLMCPNNVAAFGRDIPSSEALWSEDKGYPCDFTYRDFYRDIGHDLPLEYISPYIHDDNVRINTGFKYYSVTDKSDNKKPYNIENAYRKAEEHAENFIYTRRKQIKKLSGLMDRPPLIVSPYDAELFGHWWFEGPAWIEFLIRKINSDADDLVMVSPSDYLKKYPDNEIGTPSFSSWGNQGYAEVWLDGSNDWIYRHTHKAIERMQELVSRFPDVKGLKQRVLNQAAREVLLSQASDWPFIIKTGTTVPYAEKRIKEHLYNFNKIYEALCRNTVQTEWLTVMEKKNNIFPDIDYKIFG